MRSSAHRTILALVLALALGVFGAACGGDEQEEAATEPDETTMPEEGAEASGEPIVLGAAIALSGLAEPFDTPPTIGAELAIEDINNAGGVLGRPLQLIKTDFRSDPALGGDAALEAINMGAEILIASCDFDFGSPGARAATERGMVAISLCASSPLFGPAGISPLAFTAGTAANVQAAAAAEWAFQEQDWRRTYLLQDQTISFTTQWIDFFETAWEELAGEGTIAGSDTFHNADPSFAAQVTRLRSAAQDLDFITICTFPPGGATLVREIRAAGIDLPIVSCLAMGGTYWLDAVPNLSDFYTAEQGTAYPDAPDSIDEVNQLLERYIETAGEPPPGASYINGYALIQMLATAIERAGTTEGEALAAELEAFEEEPTLAGPTTFTEELHIRANAIPYAIMEIRNGEPRFVTRVTPSFIPEIEF